MATSRVKTNLFLTFEVATKWQNVCYTQRSYRLISLNQPKSTHPEKKNTKSTPAHQKKKGATEKKAQKSTTVLLKALTTIPVINLLKIFSVLAKDILPCTIHSNGSKMYHVQSQLELLPRKLRNSCL